MVVHISRQRVHPVTLLCADAVVNGCRTVRAVAKVVDRSPSTTFAHLLRARELGLIDWQDNHQGQIHPVGVALVAVIRKGP